MIGLMVNYYFNLIQPNFKLILVSIAILGLLSIVITFWFKIEMRQNFVKSKIQIFHYKNSRIIWSALGIGFITILIGKDADSEVKILALSIGIYLVLSQIIDFISGKYFKTNILAVTENSLIDLNGRIKEIKYEEIKSYKRESESFVIQEKYDTYSINEKKFIDSQNMINYIEKQFINQEKADSC